mmetsp:Transcript_42754/g.78106  ORF Transcript_42754/g.78106 Transcript_42754/m.78106 type:complete len:369 (-) Transcript_42754:124-1230(-)
MMRALWLKFLASSSFLLAADCVAVSLDAQSCETDFSSTEASLSLLQLSSERKPAQSQKQGPVKKQGGQHSVAGAARAALPKHLYRLGLKLLRTEEILDAVVANTREETSLYAWEAVTFRIPIGDQVDSGDNYGLDSLGSEKLSESGMMNMLDIGGNLGRVTIAAFKQAPQKMRIVVVEPVPVTHFLLTWNLWLNGIPMLSLEEFKSSPKRAGVLALNNAITGVDGESVRLCDNPPQQSMKARTCDCSAQDEEFGGKICVVGQTMDYFLNIFSSQTIDLLKMDCEGCEFHALPALTKYVETSGQRIVRFTGELHEQGKKIEDLVCQFDGGRGFWHVCFMKDGQFKTVDVGPRCKEPARDGCLRTAHGFH